MYSEEFGECRIVDEDPCDWEIEEIIDDSEYQELYEKDEVDDFISKIESMVSDAIKEIQDIAGIDKIDECREILGKVVNMIY